MRMGLSLLLATAFSSAPIAAEMLYTCEEGGRKTFRSGPCEGAEKVVGSHNMDRDAGLGVPQVRSIPRRAEPDTQVRHQTSSPELSDHEKQVNALQEQLRREERLRALSGSSNPRPPKLQHKFNAPPPHGLVIERPKGGSRYK